MNFHILYIEPAIGSNRKRPKTVTDFIEMFTLQVEKIGGKIYVNHDVIMLGNYDATYLVAINYPYIHLPESSKELRIITKSFHTEPELLEYSLFRNISAVKKEYLKSQSIRL